MGKLFLAMFGGTPARGELCLYLNAAAGLYSNCEGIKCYPIDKDTESKNYTNTRDLYNLYQNFQEVAEDTTMASVGVSRAEDMFRNMLSEAGIDSGKETLQYLMGCNGGRSVEDRILRICFANDDQEDNMKGGYYGKANIGSVAGDILMQEGIYEKMKLYQDIDSALSAGNELDVVIICSSFGGTGASLGINFGEYLRSNFGNNDKFRMHCIFIQPYFSFPDPKEDNKRKVDSKQFYAKSATVMDILGQKEDYYIRKDDKKGVFDSFYYLGQEVLDRISDENSAVSKQDNRIHMVDMLVSLAVQNILLNDSTQGTQLYGYQYSNGGTDALYWEHMPSGIQFKTKHVCMMRFCEFMLDCMEPLFADDYVEYEREMLMNHLYGSRRKRAVIDEDIKIQLHKDMKKCFEFCRSYVKYWIELEENTKFGNENKNVMPFFNLGEMKRVLTSKNNNYQDVRLNADSIDLTQTGAYKNYEKGNRCIQIYDKLCSEKSLKGIAGRGKEKSRVAKTLVKVIYEKCAVENYKSLQD